MNTKEYNKQYFQDLKVNNPERYKRNYTKANAKRDKLKKAIYDKAYYIQHKESFEQYSKTRRNKLRALWQAKKAYFVELKGGKCFKCKSVFPLVCYDFHHINPKEKDKDLFRNKFSWPNRYTIDRLKLEIDKCLLLCSNCHRTIHFT